MVSLPGYAELTQTVLPRGASSFSRIWRIDLATLAVSHVLPGSTAGAGARCPLIREGPVRRNVDE